MEDMQNDSVDISFNSSELSCLRLETPKSSQEDLANSHKRKSSSTADSHDYKRKFTSVTLSPIDDDIFDIPQEEESIASSSEDTSPISLHRETSVKLNEWLDTFKVMSSSQQYDALNELISTCSLPHIRFMRAVIEPLLRRDFISLLPKEISLYILSFLSPRDLSHAAQICHYWKKLAEDTKLWKQKCQNLGLKEMFPPSFRRYGGWESSPLPTVVMDLSTESTSIAKLNKTPLPNSCYCRCKYKALYLRHTRVMSNWKNRRFTATCQLRGHDEHVITCLQIKGDLIVTGSDDNTIRVWSAATATCLHVLNGHTGGVWTLQISEDGQTICSGATDRTVRIWSTNTGELLHCLHGHTSTVRCMALYKDMLVTGSRDCTIRLWNIKTGLCVDQLYGHLAAVRCVQFDGHRIVSGGYDFKIIVWDSQTGRKIHILEGHKNRVYSLLFDHARNIVISGSLDTTIRVWDVLEGCCLHTLVGHTSLTSGMQLLDNILVSANADSTIKVWDINTGHCIHTLDGHDSAVTSLQFIHGKLVASSSDDGTVKLWDVQKGSFICDLVKLPSSGAGGCVWRLKATPTMLVCAVGSRYGTEDTKLILLECDAPYP